MIFLYISIVVLLIWYLFWKNCNDKIFEFLKNPKKGGTKTPEDLKVPYDVVFFDTNDGVELSGWFIESVNETDECFIICGDGFYTKSDLVDGTIFLKERFNLFYFDFRGTGFSKGLYKFGFEESKDIEAAYKFLKENRSDFSKKIYIYSCGFSFQAVINSGKNLSFEGAIIRKPVIYPFEEIEKMIKSKTKILICSNSINKFFKSDIINFSVDTKSINYPVIFISDKKIETSSKTHFIKNEDELKKIVFEFFRH